jgi:hypothetical protein
MAHMSRAEQRRVNYQRKRQRQRDRRKQPYQRSDDDIERYISELNRGWKGEYTKR